MKEIYKRRSIRKYLDKTITDELIIKILKAGMNAPSARNLKSYEFIIVKNKQKLEKLSFVKKNAYVIKDSNVTIVILGREESEFWQLDIGATVQNILLEATCFDIASCWVGINEEQEAFIKNELNIPKDIRVVSMVALGYAKEEKEANDNYYPDKIHYDYYNEKY